MTTPPASTRISVVIPVKDDAPALSRCLGALASQSRAPDEVVVVDNGSSDDSAATGSLVLRLDADSLPGPDWVAAYAVAFRDRPDVAAFTGGARFHDGPVLLRTPLASAYLIGYALAGFAALGHLPLFGSNMGFRREAWLRVRGRVHRLDAEVHDDLDLAFHLGERRRIRFLPGAALGISMRPFHDVRAFRIRVRRGFRTVLRHWPVDFPVMRWDRRFLRAAGRAAR